MVSKFFAYYKLGSEIKRVNVYEALKLKNSLIKNKDAAIEFWDTDSENAERVFPIRTSRDGKAAHFSYYRGSTHAGIVSKMTMTHKIYQIAYSESDKLLLYSFGKQVRVFIRKSYMEYFFKTTCNEYHIDVMLELEKTEPAFYYYKWSGKLALEINVTHRNEKSKTNDLTENGIQIFQVNIYDNQRIPENIDEVQFEDYKQSIKRKLKSPHYKVVGSCLNNVFPKASSDMEKSYIILADFENEKKSLESRIKYQQDEITYKESRIRKIEEQIQKSENSLKLLEEKRYQLNSELTKNKDKLDAAAIALRDNSELLTQHNNDQNTILQLQAELEKEKNKGLLKRIFNK